MINLKNKYSILFICILIYQSSWSQFIPYYENGKWGFANTEGKIVINCIYEEVNIFSNDNLAKVKKDGKYSYINTEGKLIINNEYDNSARIYEVFYGDHSMGD